MAATPIFDKEIVKLRRILGDIYTTDDVLITTSNVGSSADIGIEYKRDELVDIYNQSIRELLAYLVNIFPNNLWHIFFPRIIPGYIAIGNDFVIAGSAPNQLIQLSSDVYAVISVILTDANSITTKPIFISPDEMDLCISTDVTTRKPSARTTYYTLIGNTIKLYTQSTISSSKVTYVKDHVTDITHSGASDLSGLTSDGLSRVRTIAEMLARRSKAVDSNEAGSFFSLYNGMIERDIAMMKQYLKLL